MATKQAEDNTVGGQLIRELYFPTFIFFKDLPASASLNGLLRQEIYSMRDEDAVGLHRSNVKQAGAWHSQDDLNLRSAFDSIVSEILVATKSAFDDLGFDSEYEAYIDNMWANVSPKYAFNRTHVHPGVIYSGVYYVQSPANCGRIYFSDPRVQAQMLRPRISDEGRKEGYNWTEVFFEPIEGRLILFPAWLVHEVEPNLAEEQGDAGDRISISFNLHQRRKSLG